MAILTPDQIKEVKIGTLPLSICEKLIPDSAVSNKDQTDYCRKGDPVKPRALLNDGTGIPKGICIHNTADIETPAGTNPAEQYTRACWPNCNMRGVAVHFFVYKDVIWQNLSEHEQGWHSGDGSAKRASKRPGETINGNLDTIAIECIGAFPESEETTARLAAYLLRKFDLSPDTDLYTHKFFSPIKNCPLYILPHWNAFFDRVKEIFNAAQDAAPADTDPANTDQQFSLPKVGDSVFFKGGWHYRSSNAEIAAGKPSQGFAKVTLTAPGARHPYHIVPAELSTCTAYGWVDTDTIVSESVIDQLAKEAFASPDAVFPQPEKNFYPAASYSGNSIVDALNSIGVNASFAHRKAIAAANGISAYSGTAQENLTLLALLKEGKLIKE